MTALDDRPLGLDADARAALFTDAHTVQRFAPTPVTDAQLAELWDLARWAPTAANLQPLRLLFVRSAEGRERLLPLLEEKNRERAAGAPVIAVLARDDRFHDAIPQVAPFLAGLQPVLEQNAGMRAEMGGYSAALQAGYLILAVRAGDDQPFRTPDRPADVGVAA